jgi:dynamin 1-like protein
MNSDSLKLMRSIKPQGQWTIDIFIKLDLMDAGMHALNMFAEHLFKFNALESKVEFLV